MSSPAHTLGPACTLHNDTHHRPPSNSSEPPPINPQFFYASAIPIDDPLSPLPPPSSDSKQAQSQTPRPFSVRDNDALAEAWQGVESLMVNLADKHDPDTLRPDLGQRGRTLGELVRFPRFKPEGKSASSSSRSQNPDLPSTGKENTEFPTVNSSTIKRKPTSTPSPLALSKKPADAEQIDEDTTPSSPNQDPQKNNHRISPFGPSKIPTDPTTTLWSPTTSVQTDGAQDLDISGRPFARAPSFSLKNARNDPITSPSSLRPPSHQRADSNGTLRSPVDSQFLGKNDNVKQESNDSEAVRVGNDIALVPVGISRLHLVEMPSLLMKPIYWSPVNDISAVIRGTWFYQSTMLPVEPDLANWLEVGYQDLKPWTETWQDELNSCVEIGAEAEMKAAYHIFPELKPKGSRPSTATGPKIGSTEVPEDRSLLPEYVSLDHKSKAAGPQDEKYVNWPTDTAKRYKNYHVIFVDATRAQILRPSLAPSTSRNRRPLAAIRKGREIGIAVTRGFNRRDWEKLHPPNKLNARAAHAKVGAYLSQSGTAGTQQQQLSCPACRLEEQKHAPQVSDLVLVIHGIGQKLSEKMDSYHFTHAINSFRREVNVELSSEVVQGTIRKEQGGIMVLPVNWRLTVSFDETADTKNQDNRNEFRLEDITPDTLPAIRSLISDVMLDIPYYLSHHRQKMIAAVIREANRIYRLWCRNNPGFHENGRVHLIAHSLGSAMALDILSQQPDKPPEVLDLSTEAASDSIFEFDTKSLFSCGSPAGFFLLLNKASLVPRRGRQKPGSEQEAEVGITGEAGQYGCLALDNVYNVMAPYDPISYRMNATVDSEYAASLKPATIPGARQGLLAGIGLKWASSALTNPYGGSSSNRSAESRRPAIKQLPSTVEMDIHNFTREELAEKRMFLLNDNGQIDFTLSTDGGPLDFQYWSMMSAHSSYWLRRDFVRFLVIEIGRQQGRQGTLAALVAQKKQVFRSGKIG